MKEEVQEIYNSERKLIKKMKKFKNKQKSTPIYIYKNYNRVFEIPELII